MFPWVHENIKLWYQARLLWEPEPVVLLCPPSWPLWMIHSLPLWSRDPLLSSPGGWKSFHEFNPILVPKMHIAALYEKTSNMENKGLPCSLDCHQSHSSSEDPSTQSDCLAAQRSWSPWYINIKTTKTILLRIPVLQIRGHHLRVEPSQSWQPSPSWSHDPPAHRASLYFTLSFLFQRRREAGERANNSFVKQRVTLWSSVSLAEAVVVLS